MTLKLKYQEVRKAPFHLPETFWLKERIFLSKHFNKIEDLDEGGKNKVDYVIN